ncbi:hypothetical protein SAMN04487939_106105 [Lysobacter sp. yr284]|uniref:hypothetical protein n=1 Tax=Lysobacter sp. yr284 TaxID=1761791 RepID=UPI00089A47DD|nr:hypothetical protein [Lysobacter sp. yr284]SDY79190.1 hypothetical protein SAMN04487939_106105 [Lysobacter sp. yr284]
MSRIVYDRKRWSPNTPIFLNIRSGAGPLAQRRIADFGASWAAAVLGPDLKMPDAQQTNYPSVGGAPWDRTLAGGPPDTFVDDRPPGWIRGHLVNGRWHGRGDTWRNLVPLTTIANPNHATVEQYIDNYLDACRRYEEKIQRDHWYGVYYCVRASKSPLSDPSETDDVHLYAYAPEFIRIDWCAVRIVKPDDQTPLQALENMDSYPLQSVATFPSDLRLPALPTPMYGRHVLPADNATGGEVLADLPADFPAAQDNGFDNWFEIHQIVPD